MKELNISATVENIPVVTAFVDEQLEALNCPLKAQMQIDIAIDELFGNIAQYAYNPDIGSATVRVEVSEDPLGGDYHLYRWWYPLQSAESGRSGYYIICGRPYVGRPWDLHGEKVHGRDHL